MALSGKVAIITGSSSGIGAATAILFAKEGAKVTITARSGDNSATSIVQRSVYTSLLMIGQHSAIGQTRLEKVAKACPAGSVLIVQGDLTDTAVQKRIIDETISKFGKLDILVNNAGTNIVSPVKEVAEASPQLIPSTKGNFFGLQTYDDQFAVNIRPVIGLTTMAIAHLAKTKGNIVSVSSGAGKRPFPGSTVYCMSKAALDMMTNCLCLELAPMGIRVNGVNPGGVRSNFLSAVTGMPPDVADKAMDEYGKKHPIGRIGEPEEIARAILFLAEEKAGFITGVNLSVDGGAVMGMSF